MAGLAGSQPAPAPVNHSSALRRVTALLDTWGIILGAQQTGKLRVAVRATTGPGEPEELAGRYVVAQWISEHTGRDVPPRFITDERFRFGWDRSPEAMARTPPFPKPHYVLVEDGMSRPAWTMQQRQEIEDWWDHRPGPGSAYRRVNFTPHTVHRETTLDRVTALLEEMGISMSPADHDRLRVAAGETSGPGEPEKLAGRHLVARWFTEHAGREISPRVIDDVRARYTWDRPADAMQRTPPLPQPHYIIPELRRIVAAWSFEQHDELLAWWDSRPGRGAGGGRPSRKDP